MPRSGLPQVALPSGTRAVEVFLTPHDYITNVQKRLGNRVWVASTDAAVPSWIHSWNTQKPASPPEATRGHYTCVHALLCGMKLPDPGITTEFRGLTASQSRPG